MHRTCTVLFRALPTLGCLLLALLALITLTLQVACSGTTREGLEYMVGGEAMQLREDLRSNGDGRRVLVIALDGVGRDELYGALDAGHLAPLAALAGERLDDEGHYAHAYAAPDILSVLPSTTMAAWSAVFTGAPAAQTGVPGNEWFAREEDRFYAPAPVSVDSNEHTMEMLNDGLVGEAIRVETVFEQLEQRAFVSLLPVYRGADLYTRPDPTDLLEIFGALAQGISGETRVDQEVYEQIDSNSVESVLAAFDEHGIPALQVLYFPGTDLYAHVAEHALDVQGDYLERVIAPLIQEVFDAYEAQGLLDALTVVVISDHGHTPVINDDRHALGVGDEGEPTSVLEAAGFRVRPPELEVDAGDHQAVVAYQGAMAYVYLADRSTCPQPGDRCDWSRPPRFKEDVVPVARAFRAASDHGVLVPELEGTIDLVMTREPQATDADASAFGVFTDGELVSVDAYLEAHPRPDLVDFERRMRGLGEGPFGHRAGDVLLLAYSGLSRPIEERFYFSNGYRSWHGSASAQDSLVPLLLLSRQREGAELEALLDAAQGDEARSHRLLAPLLRRLFEPAADVEEDAQTRRARTPDAP